MTLVNVGELSGQAVYVDPSVVRAVWKPSERESVHIQVSDGRSSNGCYLADIRVNNTVENIMALLAPGTEALEGKGDE